MQSTTPGYWDGFWDITWNHMQDVEFGIWVADKIVFLFGVLLAAWLAQKIFNTNARLRENRERRIEHLEKITEDGIKLQTQFYIFSGTEDDKYISLYNELLPILNTFISSSALYGFQLEEQILALKKTIDDIVKIKQSGVPVPIDSPPVNNFKKAFVLFGEAIGKAHQLAERDKKAKKPFHWPNLKQILKAKK
ncbi:MAG: hypothetical protein V7785_21910 [Bermanella sp.]